MTEEIKCKSYYFDENGDLVVETVDDGTFKFTNPIITDRKVTIESSPGCEVKPVNVEFVCYEKL